MGFDFGDIWNPIEQTTDAWNAAFGPRQIETHAPPSGGMTPTGATTDGGRQILAQTGLPMPDGVDDGMRQALLAQQGGIAGQFADKSQAGYAEYGKQGQSALDALRRQASGQDSVSAEQLRQALGQQYAQQRSYAAGASPRNAAGAARTAAIQTGRAGTAMAGQQAAAGLQERQQANAAYGNLLGTMRGQDLSAALQSRQNANAGYGAAPFVPQKSWIEQYGPAITGAIAAYASAASDRRLKTDVKDGTEDADRMLKALRDRAVSYKYKDAKRHGEGEYTGMMAQDLQRAGSRAVVDTPGGKMVHGARLATENTAMLAALAKRVAKLEDR